MQKLGTELSAADQKRALAWYVHRFTRDHIPSWAKRANSNGLFCNVQFASDQDWLAHNKFKVTKSGQIDLCGTHCESAPTWPDGQAMLTTPYKRNK